MTRRHRRRWRPASAGRGRGRLGPLRGRRLAVACAGLFALPLLAGALWPRLAPDTIFPDAARQPVAIARVIDGDTLVLADGARVRILNIDTAEMPPRSQCQAETQLAYAARARLTQLTSEAREITLSPGPRDRDAYGRLLRRVRVDGRDVGELLVDEGLARRWRGRKAVWC